MPNLKSMLNLKQAFRFPLSAFRYVSCSLILLSLVITLAACGGSSPSDNPPPDNATFSLKDEPLFTLTESRVDDLDAELLMLLLPNPEGRFTEQITAAEAFDGGAGTIQGGNLTLSLGKPKAAALKPIGQVGLPEGVVPSNPDTRVFQFNPLFEETVGVGGYAPAKVTVYPRDHQNEIEAILIYTEAALALTGESTDEEDNTVVYDCELKAGWNVMIFEGPDKTATVTAQTAIPAACKWYVIGTLL